MCWTPAVVTICFIESFKEEPTKDLVNVFHECAFFFSFITCLIKKVTGNWVGKDSAAIAVIMKKTAEIEDHFVNFLRIAHKIQGTVDMVLKSLLDLVIFTSEKLHPNQMKRFSLSRTSSAPFLRSLSLVILIRISFTRLISFLSSCRSEGMSKSELSVNFPMENVDRMTHLVRLFIIFSVKRLVSFSGKLSTRTSAGGKKFIFFSS